METISSLHHLVAFLIVAISLVNCSTYSSSSPVQPLLPASSDEAEILSFGPGVEPRGVATHLKGGSGETGRHFKKDLSGITPPLLPTPRKQATRKEQTSPLDMTNLLEQNCLENDNVTQQACFEYCTTPHMSTSAASSPTYDSGMCDSDEKVCICENTKNGDTKRVKLYKPKPSTKTRKRKITTQTQTKLVPLKEKGAFDCDNTAEANSICQVFCTTKGASHSACSLDRKSCLCFKTQSKTKLSSKRKQGTPKRTGRFLEEDDPTVEKLIGLGLVIRHEDSVIAPDSAEPGEASTRQMPYWSPPFQLYPQQHMQSPGCTPFSCVQNCPRHCDNLCTQNLQCFCSCPEDTMYYDYVEDGPAYPPFSFFG